MRATFAKNGINIKVSKKFHFCFIWTTFVFQYVGYLTHSTTLVTFNKKSMDKPTKSYLVKGSFKYSENETIEMQLSLYFFNEDDYVIAYCPALDLSGYGATESEADEDFKVVLSEYFTYTMHKNTIREDLKKMGWQLKKSLHKKMKAPSDEQVRETNENFNNILLSNPSIKKVNRAVQIPVFA